MMEIAEEGVAILMISSELPEVLGMSDRIAVMNGGTIVKIFDREEATQDMILSVALGHTGNDENRPLQTRDFRQPRLLR